MRQSRRMIDTVVDVTIESKECQTITASYGVKQKPNEKNLGNNSESAPCKPERLIEIYGFQISNSRHATTRMKTSDFRRDQNPLWQLYPAVCCDFPHR